MASQSTAGVRVVVLDTVGSTNAEALSRARTGDEGPLWITARVQTAGRGRRSRTWVSEPGNLYATLLLTAPSPPEFAAQLSFVAGLALHDAITACAPLVRGRLTLKWPNDGLIDGRKFAGILIEGEGRAVAVGIGVNCTRHPSETSYPATDLTAAGLPLASEAVLAALAEAMTARLAQWRSGAGFAAIRADWLARAHGLGSVVRIGMAEAEREGLFETIDEAGRLVLRRPDGILDTITAGDVMPDVMPALARI